MTNVRSEALKYKILFVVDKPMATPIKIVVKINMIMLLCIGSTIHDYLQHNCISRSKIKLTIDNS